MQYKVPFVKPKEHYLKLKPDIDQAITDCLNNGDLIMRKQLQEFEQSLAAFLGVKYAVGVASGYHALYFSLIALGIGRGDEVLTVGHTFLATVSAIVNTGATPVLAEVGEDYNMNPDLIEQHVGPRTKVILPVHLNGRVCNMNRILDIAHKHGLVVLEDAAQAIGATFKNQAAGSFGDIGCFSFFPFKVLGGFGDGGAITTNNPDIAEKMKLLRYNGEDRETGEYHYHGESALLDNVQAAVLSVKLTHLPSWIQKRRRMAQLYHQGLKDIREIKIPRFDETDHKDIFQNYVIRTAERDKMRDYLKSSGIETLVHWPKPMWEHKGLNIKDPSLPETERICTEVISLPLNAEMEEGDVETVVQTIKDYTSLTRE